MRVSEVLSVTMKRVLVLLVAAIMAVMLSISVAGITAAPADAHTVPACEMGLAVGNPHCKPGHDKKPEPKKPEPKKDKKDKKKDKKYM